MLPPPRHVNTVFRLDDKVDVLTADICRFQDKPNRFEPAAKASTRTGQAALMRKSGNPFAVVYLFDKMPSLADCKGFCDGVLAPTP